MRDEIVEPFELSEVYVDSFAKYEIIDDTLTCIGYRNRKGSTGETLKVGVIRIIMPVKNLTDTIANAVAAAKDLPPLSGFGGFGGMGKTPH